MSTEDAASSGEPPLTRAQLRAQREAAAAAGPDAGGSPDADGPSADGPGADGPGADGPGATPPVPAAPMPVTGLGATPEDLFLAATRAPLLDPAAPDRLPGDGARAGIDPDPSTAEPQAPRDPAQGPDTPPRPSPYDARPAGGADAKGRARRGARGAGIRRGRFALVLTVVVVVLALVGGGLAFLSLTQGPRLSNVQADPAEAITLSGSRVILTANQPLAAIDPAQVTVVPEVPFTVDASGRDIGVRFTVPLDDDTEYTVTVAGATGVGGGPASDLSTTFTTPAAEVYLLVRSEGDDTIFRANLAGEAVPVFTHERINDFREAGDALVVAVEEGESTHVLVVGKDGAERHELALPGDGFVSTVQVSDRGGLVGFVYSDRDLTEVSGRASVLVTQPISGGGEPQIVEVAGEEASVAQWHFVPDTSSVLFIDFSGTLFVADQGGESTPLGLAQSIQGLERGTYTAVVERSDGSLFRLDLADGTETDFPASDPDYGIPVAIAAYPGGTVQHIIAWDEYGMPLGQAIVRVDDAGAATPILEVGEADAILQACPSPSGQYLAVSVAPDLVRNPFDDLLFPLPERMETHLFDLRTGEALVPLSGVNISWCTFAAGL